MICWLLWQIILSRRLGLHICTDSCALTAFLHFDLDLNSLTLLLNQLCLKLPFLSLNLFLLLKPLNLCLSLLFDVQPVLFVIHLVALEISQRWRYNFFIQHCLLLSLGFEVLWWCLFFLLLTALFWCLFFCNLWLLRLWNHCDLLYLRHLLVFGILFRSLLILDWLLIWLGFVITVRIIVLFCNSTECLVVCLCSRYCGWLLFFYLSWSLTF